jgi:pimeloyl-ACP methyl ester carboxylesterase
MTQTGTIRTDGATLYYERRGTGPALVMISGGGGDAAYYSGVGDRLADEYTVLSYDRRGHSRSTVDDPAKQLDMAEQSADAVAVLRHNDFAKALVFGGSGGALIGLDLAARHGEVIEGLIAHEPPVFAHLSKEALDTFDDIKRIAVREGPWPAYARFVTSLDRPDSPALLHNPTGRRLIAGLMRAGAAVGKRGPNGLRDIGRLLGNGKYLITNELMPFYDFVPDYEALAAVEFPIVLAAGAGSRRFYPGQGADEVAKRLGAPVVEFPGMHAGYLEEPADFAVTLRKTLAELRAPAH